MKAAVLFVSLAAVVAASAAILTTPSSSSAPEAPAKHGPPATTQPAKRTLPATTPSSVLQAVAVEARRSPVPFLVTRRAPVNVPAAEAAASQEVANDVFGESGAKVAIEADGYKRVRMLRKGVGGVWHARGLRGTTEVTLTVDASGTVSTAD